MLQMHMQSDRFYNAGWTEDIRIVLDHLQREYPMAPLFAIGTSIGANVLVLNKDYSFSFFCMLLASFDPVEQLCLALNYVEVCFSSLELLFCITQLDALKATFKQIFHAKIVACLLRFFNSIDMHVREVHKIDNISLNLSHVSGQIPWGRG